MGRKTCLLTLILLTFFFLVGCENNKEEQANQEKRSNPALENTNHASEKEVVAENKADDTDPTTIKLSGNVENKNGKIVVNGESNLIEGTKVEIDWLDRPFSIRNPICLICDKFAVVDKNGNFTYEIPTDLKGYGNILVTIKVAFVGSGQTDEIEAIYGEHGENLKGPFVYKDEITDVEYQKIYAPILVLPSGEETVYPIETPKRETVPNDYGSANVWVETELTNDHYYFYIKGKSNLLEGTALSAFYYSSEDASLAQNWVNSSTNVVSDGTFSIQIPYDTITENGYITITSEPSSGHILKTKMKQLYGEHFEKMTGELVIPNKESGKMIQVVLYPKPPIVKAPEKTRVTTDGEETKIQLPDDILFNHDQSDLKPDSQKTLNELIQALEKLKADTVIQINGHTDNTGDDQYNMMLSEKRAKSVEAYLRQSGKIDAIKISTSGYGESMPIASNDSEEGKAKNRRVEIVINPK
ncbi:OmpA family protein [Cytobacillus praedii]|uniref:OmpA family protein n=1 Tax=Cytobacillus praedii TaxID=1742358 RepID=UPI002E1E39EF|nr:OmpA family protein [Cytobacillus praedii]